MATIGVNALVEALRERLEIALSGSVYVTRRTREPAPEEMPCLQVGVTTEQTNAGENQPDWTINVGCFLWLRDSTDEGPVPGVLDVIDKIKAALMRPATETHGGYWTNLGGLAWYARPLSVDSLPDVDVETQGLAVIRIEVRAKPTR